MLVVGLTGGIASGKSTVSRLLSSKHQFPVIDADVLARKVVEPGTPAHAKIVQYFGTGVLLQDGSQQLDRKRLGDVIFRDEQKRKVLNGIVHPAVRWAMLRAVVGCWLRGESVCILDIPLLIETKLWKMVGWVVLVYCSKEIQLRRLMDRDGIPVSAAQDRIASQMLLSDKVEYADRIIDNSSGLVELERQVDELAASLRAKAGWSWRLSWLFPPWGLVLALWKLSLRALVRHVSGSGTVNGQKERSKL
ncbi:hypothetical protein FRC19_001406 [Serendipita sp. 401]|nr:hypothetical protein FRC19_001406 [Serendipita sp. 401]KAG8863235.1 hypothetical protein FRC20_010850 [Serendipita sp. 405]